VEFSLGPEDAFLTQRTWFHNPTRTARPWMSWSNAGVPGSPDTEFHFPGGPVLAHGDSMRIIDWATEGPRAQRDVNRMIGYFWRDPDCGAFGAYTPSLGAGLYHVADPAQTPGIKLWTDGVGSHEAWVDQWTMTRLQCLEIQAGPIIDQSIKAELGPGADHVHVEFWIPTDRPLDIHAIELPRPALPPLSDIPRFDFAREHEVGLWRLVVRAFEQRAEAILPAPPGLCDNRWAPSGMEDLDEALAWAAGVTHGEVASGWHFQRGAWLAGNDRIDEALAALKRSRDGRAHALAARLHRRHDKDYAAAVERFRAIETPVLANHPQVVFERDLALEGLGPSAYDERRRWLAETETLADEWLVERRAALMIDEGRLEEAKALLETTAFQLIHQRYARTKLWQRIEEGLGILPSDRPNWMGEDDLHEFGAYREYPED
jgi:hypothetical protein